MRTSSSASTRTLSKKMLKAKKILLPLGIIALGLMVFIIAGKMAPKAKKKSIDIKPPLVEVIEVESRDVVFEIESQGSITPRTETTLVSEVSGVIKKVSNKFVVGGFFKKGELLLEIDPINYEVALLQSQAKLDGANAKLVEEEARSQQAKKEWQLTGRALSKAPILALRQPQLQQAKADVKAMAADVKSAQIKLARTKILAPYDAMLKAKMVDIGQYVSIGSQLVKTFAIDYVEVRLPIKSDDLDYINIPIIGNSDQQGSPVELSIVHGGELKKWDTFISRSEGYVDASSRVNYVVAQINDPYGFLSKNNNQQIIPIGSFVKAKIYSEKKSHIMALPVKAVIRREDVYLLDQDKKLVIKKIKILRSDADNIYLSEGELDNGSQIIITKLATPINGMQLSLKGDSESKSESESESELESESESESEQKSETEKETNQQGTH